MRAVAADVEASVTREGVTVHYARYGDASPTLVLLPTWSLVHSRHWKMQVPYLARHYTVLTFDGRGSGRSDRPASPASYSAAEFAADALAVMDATETERAVLVSASRGALWSLQLCAEHPERVLGAIFIAPGVPFAPPALERVVVLQRFDEVVDEPVSWETKVRCPVLVIHGSDDAVRDHSAGASLAERTCGTLVTLEGSGHFPHTREPVQLNLLIRQFVEGIRR